MLRMKYFILLLFVTALSIITSCTRGDFRYNDNSDIYLAGTDGYSGVKVVYYKDGTKMSETTYEKGIPAGKEIQWRENGNVKYETSYNGGKKEDTYTSYFENGTKKTEGEYKGGKRHGKWTWWNEKGEVSYELCYSGC